MPHPERGGATFQGWTWRSCQEHYYASPQKLFKFLVDFLQGSGIVPMLTHP